MSESTLHRMARRGLIERGTGYANTTALPWKHCAGAANRSPSASPRRFWAARSPRSAHSWRPAS
ncbi:hypothetical protein [Kribbella sp. NPDC049227]|uniref:hypothetical protein n=1 Tax=Kribbella sp. NPDC049227 TaxID=3364113 RepID=UPI00372117D5